MNKNTKYYISFNKCSGIGPKNFRKILDHFDSLESAWKATTSDFIQAGLKASLAVELVKHISKTNPSQEVERLQKLSIDVLTLEDNNYPKNLKEIYLPPAILYLRGKVLKKDGMAISIVGSRKVTEYGIKVTESISKALASRGLTIVSGLALGVDTVAHKAALKTGARTIAVLGCGVEKPYPYVNTKLATEIAKNGAIISEYPIGTPPLKHHFPARNRIISGLSLGTVVTEAAERSGALITAKDALEQGREVFAVPGSLGNENSKGPNNLIKMGAKPVTEVSDILEELGLKTE